MMSLTVSASACALWTSLDAGGPRFGAARDVGVVADHRPAVGDQIARERAAHDAEADDADGALHCRLPEFHKLPVIPVLVTGIQRSAGSGVC